MKEMDGNRPRSMASNVKNLKFRLDAVVVLELEGNVYTM